MKWNDVWKIPLMICTHENFLYNTGNVNRSYQAVLSFIAIKIFADVHRAMFASARPSQHLESYRQKRTPSKIKLKRLPKRETYIHQKIELCVFIFLFFFFFFSLGVNKCMNYSMMPRCRTSSTIIFHGRIHSLWYPTNTTESMYTFRAFLRNYFRGSPVTQLCTSKIHTRSTFFRNHSIPTFWFTLTCPSHDLCTLRASGDFDFLPSHKYYADASWSIKLSWSAFRAAASRSNRCQFDHTGRRTRSIHLVQVFL